MAVSRFSISLEEDLLEKLDKLVEERNFPNRSQAVRFLIETKIVENKWASDTLVAGVLVLVYDHHKRELQSKSTHLQHDYHHLILAVQHVHLNHDNCLETLSLKGKASELQKLAHNLIALKGIRHGELVMSTFD